MIMVVISVAKTVSTGLVLSACVFLTMIDELVLTGFVITLTGVSV